MGGLHHHDTSIVQSDPWLNPVYPPPLTSSPKHSQIELLHYICPENIGELFTHAKHVLNFSHTNAQFF